jgi:phage/plasmid-associated DNA primase
MKKLYEYYEKYCEEEGSNAFSNKTFGLRLGSVVNKLSTTKNKTCYRYYLIKDSVKNNIAILSLMISWMILKEFKFNL